LPWAPTTQPAATTRPTVVVPSNATTAAATRPPVLVRLHTTQLPTSTRPTVGQRLKPTQPAGATSPWAQLLVDFSRRAVTILTSATSVLLASPTQSASATAMAGRRLPALAASLWPEV